MVLFIAISCWKIDFFRAYIDKYAKLINLETLRNLQKKINKFRNIIYHSVDCDAIKYVCVIVPSYFSS